MYRHALIGTKVELNITSALVIEINLRRSMMHTNVHVDTRRREKFSIMEIDLVSEEKRWAEVTHSGW